MSKERESKEVNNEVNNEVQYDSITMEPLEKDHFTYVIGQNSFHYNARTLVKIFATKDDVIREPPLFIHEASKETKQMIREFLHKTGHDNVILCSGRFIVNRHDFEIALTLLAIFVRLFIHVSVIYFLPCETHFIVEVIFASLLWDHVSKPLERVADKHDVKIFMVNSFQFTF